MGQHGRISHVSHDASLNRVWARKVLLGWEDGVSSDSSTLAWGIYVYLENCWVKHALSLCTEGHVAGNTLGPDHERQPYVQP